MVALVNTQTHLLMATAILLPAAPLLMQGSSNIKAATAANNRSFKIIVATLIGALLPDASLFLMFFIGKAQGVAESVIFNEWYFSPTWQRLGAMTNSLPVYACVVVLAYLTRLHLITIAALAALMHCITDFPLHHDDGHPHFWPISDWIYSSPVSYWDPKHFGHQWSLIELCLAAAMVAFLWQRSANKLSRAFLGITALSYGVVALFWFTTFG